MNAASGNCDLAQEADKPEHKECHRQDEQHGNCLYVFDCHNLGPDQLAAWNLRIRLIARIADIRRDYCGISGSRRAGNHWQECQSQGHKGFTFHVRYIERGDMNTSPRVLVSLLVAILAAVGGLLQAAEHQDGRHQDHGPARLELDHGKKWPTDAPLRQGMAALRSAFAERLAAIHNGRLSAEDYAVLGAKVETEVGNIVAQCKLEPKADAMLHIVVADLLDAATIMRGKAQGNPAAAAHKAVNTLNGYGHHFDHPQWRTLK